LRLAQQQLQLPNGVLREFFPATCNATFVALQAARKIASCNSALTLVCIAEIKTLKKGRSLGEKVAFLIFNGRKQIRL